MSNRLRQLRLEKGLSMRGLADKTGINYTTISKIELGEREMNLDHLERLSKFFDCSFKYLQGDSEERKDVETRIIIPSADDISFAFYNQRGIVTEEQKKEIENFIAYVKSKNDEK